MQEHPYLNGVEENTSLISGAVYLYIRQYVHKLQFPQFFLPKHIH